MNRVPSLAATGLGFTYGRSPQPALVGLNFSFESSAIAVLGPHGAGKSTLFYLLSTALTGFDGAFSIGSWNSADTVAIDEHRRTLGYVPQGLRIFGGYTALEFLRYVAWLRKTPTSSVESNSREALEVVGLTKCATSPVKTLSGGMKQRLALASALVSKPRLLLLDEPTVGLDPLQRSEFRAALRVSMQLSTVVLATHLVDDVAAVAEDVLVLNHGQQVFAGPLVDFVGTESGGVTGPQVEEAYLRVVRDGA